jgi:hypothetical protein
MDAIAKKELEMERYKRSSSYKANHTKSGLSSAKSSVQTADENINNKLL